jgi:glycerophosphoryl diester phosphodiesterase
VDEALCQFLHAAQKQILVWTVNGREEMLQLRSWGVDGIIADDTKLLVEVLRPTLGLTPKT